MSTNTTKMLKLQMKLARLEARSSFMVGDPEVGTVQQTNLGILPAPMRRRLAESDSLT